MKSSCRKLGVRFQKPEICVNNNVYFTCIFDGDLLRLYVGGVQRRRLRLNEIWYDKTQDCNVQCEMDDH